MNIVCAVKALFVYQIPFECVNAFIISLPPMWVIAPKLRGLQAFLLPGDSFWRAYISYEVRLPCRL